MEKILSRIIEKGPEFLQVIADFDETLSRRHINGVVCTSSAGVVSRSHLVPEDLKAKNIALFNKYYPIEICHKLSTQEKIPHMIDWYTQSQSNIVNLGLNKSRIEELVSNSTCVLRDNANYTLQTLHDANIPVLIISAGVGDVLEQVLRSNNALFPKTKIVANCMEFDENGHVTGFKKPLIHTFNKCEVGILEKEYFESISQRNNVILMGDCIGDHEMDTGVKNPDAILKIGFLNHNIEVRLSSFLETFDIVILDDQSMDFVNLLLKFILRQ